MFKTIRNAWAIPELRKKILFTIFALLIFRLGSAVPVPWVDTANLGVYLNSMSGSILGLINAMNGSAFSIAAVFALGVQPYINSSIIIQLLTVAIPALERMQKDEGEEGRKKIAAITRYTTVGIAIIQGFGYYMLMRANSVNSSLPILDLSINPVLAGFVIVVSFTAGSAFVMWLGEQITEFGIGNGISIILFAGIISRVPSAIQGMITGVQTWSGVKDGTITAETWKSMYSQSYSTLEEAQAGLDAATLAPWFIPLIVIGMLLLIVFVVFITDAERRIPVQYAKRVVGRKMYGGQSTHIPMKVSMAGVMPIIFAQAIASLPATICAFAGIKAATKAGEGGFWEQFLRVFNQTGWVYAVVYALLILGFSYFYATMQFNPVEVANNLKKNGGFVPGYRPGKPTADFIHKVLNKITLFGAIYLAVIAVLPIITGNLVGISSLSIGGTSVIIVVGVALETAKALEAQMLMRHYKGFLE